MYHEFITLKLVRYEYLVVARYGPKYTKPF